MYIALLYYNSIVFLCGFISLSLTQVTLLTDSEVCEEEASCPDDSDNVIEQSSTQNASPVFPPTVTELDSPPRPRERSVSSTESESGDRCDSGDEYDSVTSGCDQEEELIEELSKLNKVHRPFRDELSMSSDKECQ